jgi:MT-A70
MRLASHAPGIGNVANLTVTKAAKIIRKAETDARRERVKQEILQNTTAPTPLTNIEKRYPVLLADLPWKFKVGFTDRSVMNHYEVISTEKICQMPVGDLTTDNAVLFLWSTSVHLPDAFEVIRTWGFEYITTMVWMKDKLGMGFYVRTKHRSLLRNNTFLFVGFGIRYWYSIKPSQ